MATALARPNLKGNAPVDESSEGVVIERLKANDFSEQIEELKGYLEQRRERRKFASNENELTRLRHDIMQFANAIDYWERAEFIPAEWTQFGTHISNNWHFPLPPRIDGFWTKDMMVQAVNYTFITNEPFRIAACRDVIARHQIEGLFEMEPGLKPAINPENTLFDWLTGEQLLRWNTSGSGRSY
jgi:hypothetical protein